MKLWGGRFQKTTDDNTDAFHSSIYFDKRLYKEDITGSIAHVNMLGKQGVITLAESEEIKKALGEILNDIESGNVSFDPKAEDIHMNIEKLLIEKIGDTGKKLHTGRSRNDQVALDIRLYIRKETYVIKNQILSLIETLSVKSEENLDTIMPGYTHLQKAQPITFAHHLSAYIEMLKRDFERLLDLDKRVNRMPLGSGALATTTYPINRRMVADELGFSEITLNSLDAVSDRDFLIELLSALSMLMMHLSRFCEEIILWSTNEFGFIVLDDAYSTGSSMMPQKKNPDMAELIRGKTGRVYGSLMSLLTVMKGLPLAYNKDMQEDKEPVFDAIDTVKMCLPMMEAMIATLTVQPEMMKEGAKGGFTNATDAADWLVLNGVAFRDAHAVIGQLVLYCIENKKSLEELSMQELKDISDVFNESFYDAIKVENCVNIRNVEGGPAKEAMTKYLTDVKDWLKRNE